MARLVRVTPIDEEGHRRPPTEIDLDSVLWMEECRDGTLLSLHEWSPDNRVGRLVNSSMLVAESEQDLLAGAMA